MSEGLDAVVVGSGPNGLAAAIELARSGASVRVLEAADSIGGGTRTAELTLPGFRHDVCSACHPLAVVSPYLTTLPLAEHGLEWVFPPLSLAHPLDHEPAVLLRPSVAATAEEMDGDRRAYARVMAPLVKNGSALLNEVLGPLPHVPRHPLVLARFGALGILPAVTLDKVIFRAARARALLAGCAAHAILPLERAITGAVGLLFLTTGHMRPWPVARGGSAAIARAMASYLSMLGGSIETGCTVSTLYDLPEARAYLFDTTPRHLAAVAETALPGGYVRRLRRFNYGPGIFKIDWALDGPIPWSDPRCLEASTVHLGGTVEEIAAGEAAVWRGEHWDRPFVLLVQSSQFDASRAPEGRQTGWAYCHVPEGSTLDRTDVIESQVERFAPGFRDRILARHVTNTTDLERYNPNNIGGSINGGAANLVQLVARPAARLDPYSTPNPRFYLCSASTPPGGGVHGMCGYRAARSALRHIHALARRAPA